MPYARAPASMCWDDRRYMVAMYVLGVTACFFFSFGFPHLVGLSHQWLVAEDAWSTVHIAQYVANGGLSGIYSLTPWYAALPGFIIVCAPFAALGDHLGLVTGYPYVIAHPSMWLVIGPLFAVTGATPVLGADYLASSLGVSRARRRVMAALIAVLMAGPEPGVMGHPEDMVALALACVALGLVVRGRWLGSALVLSAAIAFQTWAVLLVPVLFVAWPAGMRLRLLVRAAAVPGALTAALLAFDFKDTISILVSQPMADAGQPLPWWHFARHITVVDQMGTLHLRAGSTSRFIAVVVAVAAAWVIRRKVTPVAVVSASAVALCARGLFEAQYWSYYMIPGAVLLWVLCATAAPGPKRLTVGMIGAFAFYASAPMSGMGVQEPALLALCVLVASAGLAAGAAWPRRTARPAPAAAVPHRVTQPAPAGISAGR